MPPNLQRIMQGGDIVERLGTYLDAVRSMDRSNVELVVKAFEELPSGYGRHLEMKLLMRSWANFDPEGALSYASNSLDAKSERRFGISGWQVGRLRMKKQQFLGHKQTTQDRIKVIILYWLELLKG